MINATRCKREHQDGVRAPEHASPQRRHPATDRGRSRHRHALRRNRDHPRTQRRGRIQRRELRRHDLHRLQPEAGRGASRRLGRRARQIEPCTSPSTRTRTRSTPPTSSGRPRTPTPSTSSTAQPATLRIRTAAARSRRRSPSATTHAPQRWTPRPTRSTSPTTERATTPPPYRRINGATCNGQHHSGCDQKPAIAPAGFGAINIGIDPATHLVYTTNLADASLSVINGASCNGTHHGGCRKSAAEDAVGNYPFAIAVDPGADTAYVVNNADVSLVPLRP